MLIFKAMLNFLGDLLQNVVMSSDLNESLIVNVGTPYVNNNRNMEPAIPHSDAQASPQLSTQHHSNSPIGSHQGSNPGHKHRYKNAGLDSQELRRRREEEGIQLRKQKREQQLFKRRNVTTDDILQVFNFKLYYILLKCAYIIVISFLYV